MKLLFNKCENNYNWLIVLIIATAFFPLRYVFFSNSAYATGAYSDFTSYSFYSTDILIFLLLILFFIKFGKIALFWSKIFKILIFFYVFWQFLGILFIYDDFTSLSLYFSLRNLLFITFFIVIAGIYKKAYNLKIFWAFAIFAGFESLLATIQFIFQKNLGLKLLGEQIIGPNLPGVAKIALNGEKFIRGYGTFPHPNILSAFLLLGVIFSLYLITTRKERSNKNDAILAILLAFNIFGLFITFSRAAIICLVLILITIAIKYLKDKVLNKQYLFPLLISVIAAVFSATFLYPYLHARGDFTDNSTKERIFYNKTGLNIIKKNTLAGVGPGQSPLHMEQYSGQRLLPWEKQPIHNYFLLLAAETGVIGFVLFCSFFFLLGRKIFRGFKNHVPWETLNLHFFLLLIYISVFLLMQFDHYFYTIEQGQVLFWLTLGIIAANLYEKEQNF